MVIVIDSGDVDSRKRLDGEEGDVGVVDLHVGGTGGDDEKKVESP